MQKYTVIDNHIIFSLDTKRNILFAVFIGVAQTATQVFRWDSNRDRKRDILFVYRDGKRDILFVCRDRKRDILLVCRDGNRDILFV